MRRSFMNLGASYNRVLHPTIAVTLVIGLALSAYLYSHRKNQFCSPGFIQTKTRCCAPGQFLQDGACRGSPHSCPAGFQLENPKSAGCFAQNKRVLISGGSVSLGPTDWDSAEVVKSRQITVKSFLIDSHEVTAQRYAQCISSGLCPPVDPATESGLPLTGIEPVTAQSFCAHAGGRLPTSDEWTFAAMGQNARRYPWGAHGLVCRRAVYGLANGPCGIGGVSPEWAGARPSGATKDGIYNLAGNVSEMTLSSSRDIALMGGNFRSQSAASLKSWAMLSEGASDEIGFRCAYDIQP